MTRYIRSGFGFALALTFVLLFAHDGFGQTFTANSGVYYHLTARHAPTKCLDVPSQSIQDGAAVQINECDWPNPSQFWHIVPVTSSTFRIVSAKFAKCLDITGESTSNGAHLQQWGCNLGMAQLNQVYSVTAAPTAGYWRIKPTNSPGTKCLDVENFGTANGTPVQQWDCGPGTNSNQDWHVNEASTRFPRTHLTHFGYYGASAPWLSNANDHANMSVLEWDQLHLIDSLPAGMKVNLNIGGHFFRTAPRRDDYWANGTCPGPTCDGGIYPDYHTRWGILKDQIAPFVNAGKIAMIYILDEPFWNMSLNGFADWETAELLYSLALDIKASFPNLPIAAVEGHPKAGVQFPSNIDWVGFDWYGATETQYATAFANMLSTMHPNQKAIVVAPAFYDKAPNPNCDPYWAGPVCDPEEAWFVRPGTLDVPVNVQTDLITKKHFYLNLALSEPRVSAFLVWHGQSRPEYGNFPNSYTVGTFDIPSVLQEWKFSMRALGFGLP